MVVVGETYTEPAVRQSYSRYCSRAHQRIMGWKVVTCSPHKLPHDSFLWAAVNTLTHILEVVLAVSNASHDVHFCSIDHYDGPCYHGNTVVLFGVVGFCFPKHLHDRTHDGEASMSVKNVYCIHCCSTDQVDGSLLLWNHHFDSTHVEEELHYYCSMELHGCNRHVDDTAVYDEMVAALFLRYVCGCCEVSNLHVVDDVVADIDDVPAAAEADDVDKSLSDHKKKTEEEGPSLPSRYFSELYHTSVNVGSLWLLHNCGHGYDWSVMNLMPVS